VTTRDRLREVKRYAPEPFATDEMQLNPDGPWVRWPDVLAALADSPREPLDVAERLAALSFISEGHRRAFREGYAAALAAHAEAGQEPGAGRLLAYLWTATGRDPNVRVCDLFDPNDPIVADIEPYLATPTPPTEGADR
jgi:hypothetical protein